MNRCYFSKMYSVLCIHCSFWIVEMVTFIMQYPARFALYHSIKLAEHERVLRIHYKSGCYYCVFSTVVI